MSTLSKLSIVGVVGTLIALAPSGDGARAQVMGIAPPGATRMVRHWHPGHWHVHGVAARYATPYVSPTTGFVSPTAGLSNDARGIAFVLGGLAGPAAFLFATP